MLRLRLREQPRVSDLVLFARLSPDSLVENVREGTTLTSSDKIVQLSTCTGDSNHIVRRYLVTGVLVSDQPTY